MVGGRPTRLAATRQGSERPLRRRRGISVVIVLAMVAIAMATSYSLMRTQFSAVRIQQNSNRHALARQAAMVGLSVAIRKMEVSGWGGVNTTITGSLNTQDSYSVTYTAGDDSLTSGSANYAEYPYRVTLISTGTSTDSGSSPSRATHKVRAVVRLIPRKLASAPSDLATIDNYTWYQSHNDTFQFQSPLHVQGKVRVQGEVELADYDWSNSASDRYFDDLDLMRQASLGDYRPFEGPLEINFAENDSVVRSWLTGKLGVSLISNSATGISAQWSHPGSISTYRLYTGGPSYTVPSPIDDHQHLAGRSANQSSGAILSIGRRHAGRGATLRGTLVGGGDVYLSGANVTLAPVDLPPIQGSTNKFRLPTILGADDLFVTSGGEANIDGLVVAFDRFSLLMRSQSKVLAMRGNLVARRFICEGRSEFDLPSTWWTIIYNAFQSQLNNPPAMCNPYFPSYLNNLGLHVDPKVTFGPPTNPVTYVWPTKRATFFRSGDRTTGGLRWELVDWKDVR